MRRSLTILTILALTSAMAPAQTLKDYLKLRKEYGIQSALTIDELDGMVGKRVVEVQCVIKGTFRVGEQDTLLVERPDGDNLAIEAAALPDWVQNGESKVRALVEANRPGLNNVLTARLVAITPDGPITDIETKARKAEEAKEAKAASARNYAVRPTAARGGFYRTTPTASVARSPYTPVYAAFIKKWNPRLSRTDAELIASCVIGFSQRKGIDPRLIMAIVMTESDFNPRCTSSAGAMGLGQLMPENVRELGLNNGYDNIQNLYGTATLIRNHLDKYSKMTNNDYDTLVLALAGYNAGDGAVKKYGGVPPYRETQNYVKKVIRYYEALAGVRIAR